MSHAVIVVSINKKGCAWVFLQHFFPQSLATDLPAALPKGPIPMIYNHNHHPMENHNLRAPIKNNSKVWWNKS